MKRMNPHNDDLEAAKIEDLLREIEGPPTELASEGSHRGIIVDAIDLGTQFPEFGQNRFYRVFFQIEELDSEGRRRIISKVFSKKQMVNLQRSLRGE